jgi:hypothetical protein
MAARRGKPYRLGELEVILSLAPTAKNVKLLSELLDRTEEAIEIVFKLAFEHGCFGRTADIQRGKILKAKKRVGIILGHK